jgi:predicted O-methyltransferase YrrM
VQLWAGRGCGMVDRLTVSWMAPCRRSSPCHRPGPLGWPSGSHANRPLGSCWLSWPRTLPTDAGVLELGTGAGVGTAWIACGLLPRDDVTVITIEKDPQTAALAACGAWPQFVDLRVGDALGVLGEAAAFDLIFADAPGGKWAGLERTIAALRPHGLLVVDDMTASPEWTTKQHARQDDVRQALLTSPLLTSVELDHGSGVILATRHA